jgi:hypothetical protein
MTSSGSEGGYDLMEVFVVKFVIADVVIIVVLLFAGPTYAVAITALLVVSVFLTWYLTQRVGTTEGTTGDEADRSKSDPVTDLQRRYTAGDLSETEFEAALDRVIDANERAERAGIETEPLSLERSDEPDSRPPRP